MKRAATSVFYKLSLSTLVAVFLLIFVGGVVRSTGSGMGCPDWPKCFGQWVPPSSVDELPSDYQKQYSAYRDKKNQKFIRFIRALGMTNTAAQLESDPAILIEEEFNVFKTRVEYINRVLGVLIGFLITLVFVASFQFRRTQPWIFWSAVVAWVSVIVTGWFGSIVVSTNLTPWTVSVHLGFAFLIVAMLVYCSAKTSPTSTNNSSAWLLFTCMVLLIAQIVLGVQVREVVDQVAHAYPDQRNTWVSMLGNIFFIHRSFSWLLVLANGFLAYTLYKNSEHTVLWVGLAGLTLASVLTGVIMAYVEMPKMVQPLHLLLSALNFGLLLWLIIKHRTYVKFA